MYISEEIHRDLIALSKKRFVPHIPTQESILEKTINEVPGVICFRVDPKQHSPLEMSFRLPIQCTRLGLINFATMYDELAQLLDRGDNAVYVITVNVARDADPNHPEEWQGIRTHLMLVYKLKVQTESLLFDASFEALHLMIKTIQGIQYIPSLTIPNFIKS